MTKILTAINDQKILKKIIKNKITENKNILYKEAIIDILKKNKNIDLIIISEKIPGDINLIKLIKKIKKINKKIKIIIILENKKMKKELIKINIKNIYYNNIFSIYKLIKKLKVRKGYHITENLFINHNINKLKNIFNYQNKKTEKNENNIICIFGENKIDKKIIELIIIKKLLIKNKNIIIMNFKLNNKREKNRKIIKIKKIKNKYNLKLKIKNINEIKIKEKVINNKIKKIININNILKNKNKMIKIKILKNIIKKYSKNKYYIVINIQFSYKNINKIPLQSKYINIINLENNKKNLLKLNKYKKENKNAYLILNNYIKNNLSRYFYKILLKNKFKKIKIINLI